jgi:hypothetical protein
MRAIGAANTRCNIGSAWSRRSSPRHIAACNAETTSIHSSGGATSSIPRKGVKPTGVTEAATATLASTTSFTDRCVKAPQQRPSSAPGYRPQGAPTPAAWEAPDTACRVRRPGRRDRSRADLPRFVRAGDHRGSSGAPSRRCVRPCSRLRRQSACCDRTPSTGGVQNAPVGPQDRADLRKPATASGSRITVTRPAQRIPSPACPDATNRVPAVVR